MTDLNQIAFTTPEDQFRVAFGEPLTNSLDLETWQTASNLGDLYGTLENEVAQSLALDAPARQAIRDEVFPLIARAPNCPPCAGVYRVSAGDLIAAQRGLLFRGAVEACNGIAVTHEALGLSVTQVGVCLVSYRADLGSWVHRLYRRDLRETSTNPKELAEQVLLQNHAHDVGDGQGGDRLSDLARRGVMAYAERAALVERSTAAWRMGHGNPVSYELLTGSGSPELMLAGLDVLRRLILDHQKFIYVPSSLAERALLTLGDALRPLEYAIVDTMTDRMRRISHAGHFSEHDHQRLRRFVDEVGSKVVIGCYRASAIGPARIFYAHPDHAHEAALIALADSTLHEHRGFPILLDLSDALCRSSFGAGDFAATLRDAYAQAGQPYAFHQEFSRG
ncbi:MAG TPA: hypothetical protein VFL82_11385 [Thermomicrobiales bacterium]|nr:hypothetical protein [Thermomicrobiales bacterium]